jgi:hypothetical protein
MQCPGQDRAYWKADAVFEAPCPQCGASVEFFKDESSGRCPSCGHRFLNPGADFGCAQWCSLAKECVGFAPDRGSPADATEGALAARLIQSIREELGGQSARIAHAMTVFRYAKELVMSEGGDPRVILAAALLMGTAPSGPADGQAETETSAKAQRILRGIGLDEPTIERVCQIVAHCRLGTELDTAEFRVVWDSTVLATLAAEGKKASPQEREDGTARALKTETGKAKARGLRRA